jgi:hypothetical protein
MIEDPLSSRRFTSTMICLERVRSSSPLSQKVSVEPSDRFAAIATLLAGVMTQSAVMSASRLTTFPSWERSLLSCNMKLNLQTGLFY